jgi:hypothetical protein
MYWFCAFPKFRRIFLVSSCSFGRGSVSDKEITSSPCLTFSKPNTSTRYLASSFSILNNSCSRPPLVYSGSSPAGSESLDRCFLHISSSTDSRLSPMFMARSREALCCKPNENTELFFSSINIICCSQVKEIMVNNKANQIQYSISLNQSHARPLIKLSKFKHFL